MDTQTYSVTATYVTTQNGYGKALKKGNKIRHVEETHFFETPEEAVNATQNSLENAILRDKQCSEERDRNAQSSKRLLKGAIILTFISLVFVLSLAYILSPSYQNMFIFISGATLFTGLCAILELLQNTYKPRNAIYILTHTEQIYLGRYGW